MLGFIEIKKLIIAMEHVIEENVSSRDDDLEKEIAAYKTVISGAYKLLLKYLDDYSTYDTFCNHLNKFEAEAIKYYKSPDSRSSEINGVTRKIFSMVDTAYYPVWRLARKRKTRHWRNAVA